MRSLEERSEGGAAVMSTSSVAFMPHRAPEGVVPPLRGMKGLMVADGAVLRQSVRTSARNTSDTSSGNRYRDIVIRKMNNFVHVIMTPQTTKIKNSLNSRVRHTLTSLLVQPSFKIFI